jgi:hypothetical protein
MHHFGERFGERTKASLFGEIEMSGVAGVNGVYVVVEDAKEKGIVYFVDGTSGGKIKAQELKGRVPFAVACSTSHGGSLETCVIMDAGGNVWRGPCRATGTPFSPVAQGFSLEKVGG